MGGSLSILFILGMHRGGTSAVARLANILGADLGKDLLDVQPDINAEGFWENRHVVALHEAILCRMGSAWYDTRPLPLVEQRFEAMRSHGPKIREILKDQYPGHGLIAIKDPRLCRLLPFWRTVLESEPSQPACLLVLRQPWEVARSIARRDGFDEDTMLLLWLVYMLEAEFHSRGWPRGVIAYDDVLGDWEKTTRGIADQIGMAWPTTPEQAANRIASDIRPELKHHHIPENDRRESSGLDATVHAVYTILKSGGIDGQRAELDRIRAGLLEDPAMYSARAEMLFRNSRLVAEANRRLDAIGQMHGSALGTIAERDRQLADANRHLEELGQMHSRALGTIAERDRQLEETNRHLEELGQMHSRALEVIEERDRLIAKIQAHWTWRVTKRFLER